MLSSRPLRAGSIAAMGVRVTGRHAAPVIPPITGGLHCGLAASVTVWQGDQGHTAHYVRAPLRLLAGPRPEHLHLRHPAHYGRAPLRRPGPRGVRPDRVGHPAHYGRAPLRHLRGGGGRDGGRVIPPITGGLHCGFCSAPRQSRETTVIPPITGGLHCGGKPTYRRSLDSTGHPAHYGRAPLRPVRVRGAQVVPRGRHPAHYGRAPLRLLLPSVVRRVRAGHPAHYGRAPLRPDGFSPNGWDRDGHPAHYGRAPLRPGNPPLPGLPDMPSSRPLRAGSIAAFPARCAPVRASRVIPPITGGLHCGISGTEATAIGR